MESSLGSRVRGRRNSPLACKKVTGVFGCLFFGFNSEIVEFTPWLRARHGQLVRAVAESLSVTAVFQQLTIGLFSLA